MPSFCSLAFVVPCLLIRHARRRRSDFMSLAACLNARCMSTHTSTLHISIICILACAFFEFKMYMLLHVKHFVVNILWFGCELCDGIIWHLAYLYRFGINSKPTRNRNQNVSNASQFFDLVVNCSARSKNDFDSKPKWNVKFLI